MSRVNTRKQNMCHTPLISDYSSVSKCLLASTHDIVLERYRTLPQCLNAFQALHFHDYATEEMLQLWARFIVYHSYYRILCCSWLHTLNFPGCKKSITEPITGELLCGNVSIVSAINIFISLNICIFHSTFYSFFSTQRINVLLLPSLSFYTSLSWPVNSTSYTTVSPSRFLHKSDIHNHTVWGAFSLTYSIELTTCIIYY